ncbi:MAG: hypothetical protein GTO41_28715 [Burkholderiales bacterium]|nr:hypothetical protein [Burkholderiales bacterium]
MQENVDAEEFAEWCAYQEIDPATEERADLRAAIIAATICNVLRGKKDRPVSPEVFMPFANRQPVLPDPQELEQRLLAWAGRHNKRRHLRSSNG